MLSARRATTARRPTTNTGEAMRPSHSRHRLPRPLNVNALRPDSAPDTATVSQLADVAAGDGRKVIEPPQQAQVSEALQDAEVERGTADAAAGEGQAHQVQLERRLLRFDDRL